MAIIIFFYFFFKDFIRAGVTSPTSEDTVISGSYDHTVKVWDARSRSSVMTFQQGSPVETLLCYPSGTLIASAGTITLKLCNYFLFLRYFLIFRNISVGWLRTGRINEELIFVGQRKKR